MFRHGDTSSDERSRIKAKPMEVRVATFQEIELPKEKQRWERLYCRKIKGSNLAEIQVTFRAKQN